MSSDQPVTFRYTDALLVKLAHEIAAAIHPLSDILKVHRISDSDWEEIRELARFQQYLAQASADWNSAMNGPERVKVKAAAMLEEWMPELYVRMMDRHEPLSSKIEAGKLVRDLAGFSKNGVAAESIGERFSVTINLGADAKLTFEKENQKMIEGEVVE